MATYSTLCVGDNPKRSSDKQLTVADLTGVAVQDIQIAKAVYEMALKHKW